MSKITTRICCVFAVVATVLVAELPTEPIAWTVLNRGDKIANATLSPNGTQLLGLQQTDDQKRNAFWADLKTGENSVLGDRKWFGFIHANWLNDTRVLLQGYDTSTAVHSLHSAKVPPLKRSSLLATGHKIEIIGFPRARPDRVIAQIHPVLSPRISRVFEIGADNSLDVSGNMTIDGFVISEDRPNYVRAYRLPSDSETIKIHVDEDGEIAALTVRNGEQRSYLRYYPETESWAAMPFDPSTTTLRLIEPGSRYFWFHRIVDKFSEIVRYDSELQAFDTPIHRDSTYRWDEATLFYSRVDQQLSGIQQHHDRLREVWWNSRFLDAHRIVQEHDPRGSFRLLDFDEQETRFLFSGGDSSTRGQLLLVDLATTGLSLVTNQAAELDEIRTYRSLHTRFRTPDGEFSNGFLTLPMGASAEHPAPLFILLATQTATREFNPMAQYWASRGYAVLQPNPGALSPYVPSQPSMSPGDLAKFSDDIAAAIQGAIGLSQIDGQRVAIFGRGDAGILALNCASRKPELFATVAVISPVLLEKSSYAERRPNFRLFHAYRETAYGESASLGLPELQNFANKLDTLSPPLFLAHNAPQPLDGATEVKHLAQRLDKTGTDVTLYFLKNTTTLAHRELEYAQMLETLEAHLAKHLK